ncbi:glycine decarboxylase (subunit 1) (glycine cleavage system protein P) [Petrocella atlantisensis]|uniref:Probable glycine dehydrogenase (decarboxylating) subunit 1 n=1 Tax=Petrocella atlantisensis TaxID=2173034 RepID=A0A3P7NXH1_9FIRM|nr:aminomethyl-transferring glycine dehydrogenase subunit GcvPA [Petrocella atlantisensis]VDN46000.1 glycine decarboxylase (subunit 1) (glycine cleavage system protein P) [Petrocella atlantisensis]
MHPYLPHTQADIDHMLQKIGVESIEDLFTDIDAKALLKSPMQIPKAKSEGRVIRKLTKLGERNIDTANWLSFVGGGIYEHMIPTIVPHLISRSEFYTAYTPYQPEISQGTLQAIFEYQTMICELTGLQVANASHYDGSTALAEAVFMACGTTRRDTILIPDTLSPESKNVLRTYLKYKDLNLIEVPSKDGVVSSHLLKEYMNEDIAAYLVATPNYYGNLEDLTGVSEQLHANKSLLVIMSNPMSLSLFKSPGEWGADIAVGDGQVFGNPMNFGGPTLGYMACTEKLMRKIPGRIVGETLDLDGNRGYVLTLQAREQHIRREKATSNITSNEALNVLAATIYLSTMGLAGIKEVARRSHINACYLRDHLKGIEGIKVMHNQQIFNEFVIQIREGMDVMKSLELFQIIPGIIIDHEKNLLLITTTEVHEKEDLDTLVVAMKEVLA